MDNIPPALCRCWLGDKDIQPVKSIATTVFLAYHDSMVAACCLQVRNTIAIAGVIFPWSRTARQPTYHSIHNLFWQHGGSTLSLVKRHCLLGDRKGIRLVKTSCFKTPVRKSVRRQQLIRNAPLSVWCDDVLRSTASAKYVGETGIYSYSDCDINIHVSWLFPAICQLRVSHHRLPSRDVWFCRHWIRQHCTHCMVPPGASKSDCSQRSMKQRQ